LARRGTKIGDNRAAYEQFRFGSDRTTSIQVPALPVADSLLDLIIFIT